MASSDPKRPDSELIAEYVIKNIDTALENGWIKVYYQPVIRTLTGQLCGSESLARWVDPEYGFLSPDKFIGALEASRQIHKLDCFMVDKACSDIAERLGNGLEAVPVSINFSRLDFEAKDMLKVLEDAIAKYDIPRDYIHVEITESMIVSDAVLMSKMIDSFRNAGYEVWMDDFGSGYSSLTLLKDYNFDTLKMDMNFLSSFTDRSKSIMNAAITMAKDINIMTLAEGVETAEQVEFLRSIGCGKLQGFFYGKPMPIDEFFKHIEEFGITIEPRQWRHYYQVASFVARYTEEPLEIIEDDGEDFRTLFINDAYQRQVVNKIYSIEDLDNLIYHTNSPLIKKYRQFANTIETSKNLETFYYTNNGNIFCFQGIEVAEHAGKHIIKGTIRNMSSDLNLKKHNNVDNKLKELNHLFDTIMLVNPEKNTISPLISNPGQYISDIGRGMNDLRKGLELMAKSFVAPADREKFCEFHDLATLKERIDASGKGFIENIFRIKQADGNFKWKELSIMLIPGTYGKEYLISTKATTDDAQHFLQSNNSVFNPREYGLNEANKDLYSKMWENTLSNASIKFFWKDKDRRFIGASKAFLDYYGLKIDDIVGKNDEEMGWHVDGENFKQDEIDVITKGAYIRNVPGQCVVNGVVHNIITNKSPLYNNGQIIGLMGYFADVEEEMSRIDELYKGKTLDPVTGLMNIFALHDATASFAHAYSEMGTDYALIILRNENHSRIASDYGEEFANKLLKKMADIILEITGGNSAVGKSIASDFAIFTNSCSTSNLKALTSELKNKLEDIKELDGNSITVKIRIAFKLRSDEDVNDENMYTLVLQELV